MGRTSTGVCQERSELDDGVGVQATGEVEWSVAPVTAASGRRTRERKHEVERELAARGLLRGPRRMLGGAGQPVLGPEVEISRLGAALEELGAVFVAFGRYLSQRADLLPATDCVQLAEIAESAPPTPSAVVEERLHAELGRPPAEVFSIFEAEPFESRALFQSHRARLPGGERLVVKVIHPAIEADLATELAALDVLKRVLTGPVFADRDHLDGAFDRFCQTFEAQLDLRLEAQALQSLGRDASRSELLVVPQVFSELSTSRVLTVQWLPGSTIDEIASAPGLQDVDAVDLARRVGLIWLQMALVGNCYPVTADVIELPDGRLAVTGGHFASLPEASRVNLWNYVRATVEHYPDRAAASLLKEVVKLRRDATSGELRTRVRQVVPFRDGGWSTAGESLGEYAVLHWRTLRPAGFCARPHLDDFYQGLFWAARTGQRFAPQGDPLGEALRDFDWLAGWNQFRQLTSPQQIGATAESYLESLVDLPQKLDRILNLATEDGALRVAVAAAPMPEHRRNRTAKVITIGLAMAACVLLAEPWKALVEQIGWSAAWGEGLLAAVFLGLGWALLSSTRSAQ